MEKKDFTISIRIPQAPQIVFDRITKDIAKWWGGKDLEGSCGKLNDEFIIYHLGAHYSKQKVVEFVPNKRIVWFVSESTLDWLKKNKHEWTNTKMIFDLSTKGDKTVLHFTHEGLSPEKECYSLCRKGWTTVITDYLFHLIVEGKPHFII